MNKRKNVKNVETKTYSILTTVSIWSRCTSHCVRWFIFHHRHYILLSIVIITKMRRVELKSKWKQYIVQSSKCWKTHTHTQNKRYKQMTTIFFLHTQELRTRLHWRHCGEWIKCRGYRGSIENGYCEYHLRRKCVLKASPEANDAFYSLCVCECVCI